MYNHIQNKTFNYEKGIIDTAISHIARQFLSGASVKNERWKEGSDKSENTGCITRYDG